MNAHSPSRSPNGCSCQVMTQITPDERDQLRAIASAENRTLSATVRIMALSGIEQYRRTRPELTTSTVQ